MQEDRKGGYDEPDLPRGNVVESILSPMDRFLGVLGESGHADAVLAEPLLHDDPHSAGRETEDEAAEPQYVEYDGVQWRGLSGLEELV